MSSHTFANDRGLKVSASFRDSQAKFPECVQYTLIEQSTFIDS